MASGTVQAPSIHPLHTFLPLVEDGRARVIEALFRRVAEELPAALVDTLLSHGVNPAAHLVAMTGPTVCLADSPEGLGERWVERSRKRGEG